MGSHLPRRCGLGRVVVVPREDTDTEIVALQTGEVMAAFPQPFPGAKERLSPPLTFVSGAGTFIEGLWINQIAPDRRFELTTNVRQALAYSLDRERIADVALDPIIDDPVVLQCAGWNPAFGDCLRGPQGQSAAAALMGAAVACHHSAVESRRSGSWH